MYTLFMQKRKGDTSPFVLTKQLYDFINDTQANGIFISPGHLSKKIQYIEDLLDGLVSLKSVDRIGIGNKYNSKSLKDYEDYLDKKGKLWEVDRNDIGDHRKMVFVFKYTDSLPKLERKELSTILDQIEIIAVVIGSSNFSYPTYGSYGTSSPGIHADKGEADIMMFTDGDDKFAKKLRDNIGTEPSVNRPIQHQMVLSKNVTGVPFDFFKEIFRETLEITLK